MKVKAKKHKEDNEGLNPPHSSPEAGKTIEQAEEALIMACLAANLGFKDIPLKEFMDNFEKKHCSPPAPDPRQPEKYLCHIGPQAYRPVRKSVQALHQRQADQIV